MSDPLSDTTLHIDPGAHRPDGAHAALKADNASLLRQWANYRALLKRWELYAEGTSWGANCALLDDTRAALGPDMYRDNKWLYRRFGGTGQNGGNL